VLRPLFNLILEYIIKLVQENRKGASIDDTLQVLANTNDML
jgi:hypothetical protein